MDPNVMSDRYFMQTALKLALKGKGKTSPNPMVGAVLVKGNRIIADEDISVQPNAFIVGYIDG